MTVTNTRPSALTATDSGFFNPVMKGFPARRQTPAPPMPRPQGPKKSFKTDLPERIRDGIAMDESIGEGVDGGEMKAERPRVGTGASGIRTRNQGIMSPLLEPLSYGPAGRR